MELSESPENIGYVQLVHLICIFDYYFTKLIEKFLVKVLQGVEIPQISADGIDLELGFTF